MNSRLKYVFIILIPLVLSAYSHLWNLLGFPSIHIDEAHYLRRALMVLEGWGPQESATTGYPRTYDHPYFGQLFLAGLLGATGYPGSTNPTTNVNSIELLHLVPRILMGILAIFDTFMIFKIGERRYNTNIGLFASILFAIMPFTWILRRVYLETLLLPLLLSSVLFAIYLKEPKINNRLQYSISKYKLSKNVVIVLSGIFLGLAIYTKIPAFTMIPLIGTLIFFNVGRSFKSLGLWLLPVLLIPMMWPLYSVVVGQTDLWLQWVLWQTDRNRPLSISIMNFFQIDPLIAIIGIAGTGYAAIRRDFLPLLWIFPFLLFSSFVGWVQYFHLVLIFPAFCIAGAILIEFIQKYLAKYSTKIISFSVAGFICVFGFVTTTMLITLDVNSSYYQVYATIAEQIPDATDQENSSITLVGSHWWIWDSYWITQYVLHKSHSWVDPHLDPKFKKELKTENVLYIDDPIFLKSLASHLNSDNLRKIRNLHDASRDIAIFYNNVTSHTSMNYPYNTLPIMIQNENHPRGTMVIKRNY